MKFLRILFVGGMKKLLLCFTFLQFFSIVSAQESPELGLVLSGGGARGFAHIGVLKVMEEAGLRPDNIAGVSAGAAVGSMYAIGYDADSLKYIVNSVDWKDVFSNKQDLREVSIEEKEYQERYAFKFYLEDGKIKVPAGVVSGDKLQNILNMLSMPALKIDKFDQLPINFVCVAADLVSGEAVVLSEGDLGKSVRASMGIPTFLVPIELNGRYLVDGGVIRNYPIPEAIEMGSDFLIGVNVSNTNIEGSAMESATTPLMQSVFMGGKIDTKNNIESLDINIVPDLTDIKPNDWDKVNIIIQRGYEAALPYKDRFKAIADSLEGLGGNQKKKSLVKTDSYRISNVNYDSLPPNLRGIVRGYFDFDKDSGLVNREMIENALELSFGTQNFNHLGFYFKTNAKGEITLCFHGEAIKDGQVKTSIYIDSDQNAGVIMNLTLRNKFLYKSRIITEFYLARNPKFRIDYLKYLGRKNRFAFRSKFYYDFELASRSLIGDELASFSIDHQFRGSAGFQTTSSTKQTFYFNSLWNFEHIHNRFKLGQGSLTESPGILVSNVKNVNVHDFRLELGYRLDTRNQRIMPMEGAYLQFNNQLAFNQTVEIVPHEGSVLDSIYQINGEPDFNEYVWSQPFLYSSLQYLKMFRLSDKLSFYSESYLALKLEGTPSYTADYFVGGTDIYRVNQIPLLGMAPFELNLRNLGLIKLGVAMNLTDNIYLRPELSHLIYPMDNAPLLDENLKLDLVGSYGAQLVFKTIAGPFTISSAYSTYTDKFDFNVSFGYRLIGQ